MLMVFERPPGQLTSKGQDLLEKLRESGEWYNRTGIARLFGQKTIYPHDVALLEELVTAGFVEKRKADKPGFIPFEWQYRATGKV
ncbi:MAG: hypothetical protein H0X30_29965 [Anaerolineae bacterium]|nr:hypothetical protein [Anaerolineae bacterium]